MKSIKIVMVGDSKVGKYVQSLFLPVIYFAFFAAMLFIVYNVAKLLVASALITRLVERG